jgi:hypothetical protein
VCEIKASGKFKGQALKDIPVLNPGDRFGKTWLIEIEGGFCPLFLAVEADSPSDALDELASNEKFAHLITVPDENLADYPEDERHYGSSGQVLDLDHALVHGQEGNKCPFPYLYHGDGLPVVGLTSVAYVVALQAIFPADMIGHERFATLAELKTSWELD